MSCLEKLETEGGRRIFGACFLSSDATLLGIPLLTSNNRRVPRRGFKESSYPSTLECARGGGLKEISFGAIKKARSSPKYVGTAAKLQGRLILIVR